MEEEVNDDGGQNEPPTTFRHQWRESALQGNAS